jgi:hypothetical protein
VKEDEFVAAACERVEPVLREHDPRLAIGIKQSLFYGLEMSNRMNVDVGKPAAGNLWSGQPAFETDICVFDSHNADEVQLAEPMPRVVIEAKMGLSTHDILTYSTKASRHKQVYPWLRYGLVAANQSTITQKFIAHNEGFDFYLAAKDLSDRLHEDLVKLLLEEVRASRLLERMAFARSASRQYRLYHKRLELSSLLLDAEAPDIVV